MKKKVLLFLIFSSKERANWSRSKNKFELFMRTKSPAFSLINRWWKCKCLFSFNSTRQLVPCLLEIISAQSPSPTTKRVLRSIVSLNYYQRRGIRRQQEIVIRSSRKWNSFRRTWEKNPLLFPSFLSAWQTILLANVSINLLVEPFSPFEAGANAYTRSEIEEDGQPAVAFLPFLFRDARRKRRTVNFILPIRLSRANSNRRHQLFIAGEHSECAHCRRRSRLLSNWKKDERAPGWIRRRKWTARSLSAPDGFLMFSNH